MYVCTELTSHKSMGFNFIRKHIKVAPHRWYYHTDRLGILVWQDMPETIHASVSDVMIGINSYGWLARILYI